MRVLVTGGAGFIGSHLADRLLAAGAEVRVLDSLDGQVHSGWPDYLSDGAERVEGDVRDSEAVRKALRGVDRLVHLAAAVGVGQSMYQIERYTSVNSVGAAVVLEQTSQVRDQLAKVVVASSMSIYGEGSYRCPAEDREVIPEQRSEEKLLAREWEHSCPTCGATLETIPTHETKPLAPASIYAIGKRDHEEMFLVWGRAYGIATTALRFFNVFGSRQSLSNPYTGVAAIFASRLLNGEPPIVFEDGRQTRDFVHVDDVVSAIASALQPDRGDQRAINIGSGRQTSILEVASALNKALDVSIEPEIKNEFRAGDIRHCFADISLAREELGYVPTVDFGGGMQGLGGWLRDQHASDHVGEATAELVRRGLTR